MDPYDEVCTVPEELSRVERKREIFAGDPYFRDAWDDLRAVCGTGQAQLKQLFRVAPLVLRPDAIATRGGARVLEAVAAQGFIPVACETFRFDRHTTREVWRYQLNIATRERIDVMDMIMPATESLYVLLRDTTNSPIPATTRLSSLKGPSRPEDRQTSHLRHIAGPAQASVLTYLHVADEPADIVRELGIFFDSPQRNQLLGRLGSTEDATVATLAELSRVESRTQSSDLCWRPALARLRQALDQAASPDRPRTELLSGLIDQVLVSRSKEWQAVLAQADGLDLDWDFWDRVAVAAELSARHLDAVPVLPDVGRTSWVTGRG
ncbi:hypothetical protein AB0K47_03375 [Streptomyces tirandamycinicus]|uniref:hypothetical protein n=1 Tax=Streptomyces tirandamycinicus TaxID=2174846 RepID=UPI0034154750